MFHRWTVCNHVFPVPQTFTQGLPTPFAYTETAEMKIPFNKEIVYQCEVTIEPVNVYRSTVQVNVGGNVEVEIFLFFSSTTNLTRPIYIPFSSLSFFLFTNLGGYKNEEEDKWNSMNTWILVLSLLYSCLFRHICKSWNKIRKTIERRLFVTRRLCREYFNERGED